MSDTFGSAIGELWPLWKPQELERIAGLERAVARVGELTEVERRAAQDEAHKLAGALAALDRPEAANGARELERRFLIGPERGDLEGLTALVLTVRTAVELD
jgi:hypothetical protein